MAKKTSKAKVSGRKGRAAKAAKSSKTIASGKQGTTTGRRKNAAKRPGPRSQTLPGMEEVRDAVLDRLCESLGETRDKQAALRIDEQADMQASLKRMRIKSKDFPEGRTSYRHAGMELSRVPGEEKLRCRRTSQGASAEVEDDTAGDGGEDALGEERRQDIEDAGDGAL